jgi:pyruvate/2-oxoglutarate dehydrogenase complex dihydrolipoamide dehydrogenase (E3) component
LSLLVLLPSRIHAADYLYAVGRSPNTNNMHLYRIMEAGFGAVDDMGQIRID